MQGWPVLHQLTRDCQSLIFANAIYRGNQKAEWPALILMVEGHSLSWLAFSSAATKTGLNTGQTGLFAHDTMVTMV